MKSIVISGRFNHHNIKSFSIAPQLEKIQTPPAAKDTGREEKVIVKKGRQSEEKEDPQVTKVKVIPFGATKDTGKKEEKDEGSKALDKVGYLTMSS